MSLNVDKVNIGHSMVSGTKAYHWFVICIFTGFIDFIVDPTFSVLTDVAEKIVLPLVEEGTKTKPAAPVNQSRSVHYLTSSKSVI